MNELKVSITLTADGKQLVGEVKISREELDKLSASTGNANAEAKKLNSANDALGSSLGSLSSVIKTVAASYAVLKVVQYAQEAALLSARYETLGVSMRVVGNNAGYTAAQMEANAVALQKTGISMVESRQQILKLVQSHIDLAASTKLARIAQDAAVIGNINSSEAFARLIQGIQTGQTETLRGIGINVSMEKSYDVFAATLDRTAQSLTQTEKTQAVLNAVIKEGEAIAGNYEAAMGTAGKQLNSTARYMDDLKLKSGEVFNEVLTVGVMAFTAGLKDANGQISELSQNGQLQQWGRDVTDMFVFLADAGMGATVPFRLIGKELAALSAITIAAFAGRASPEYIDSILASLHVDQQAVLNSTHVWRDALAERRQAVEADSVTHLARVKDFAEQEKRINLEYASSTAKERNTIMIAIARSMGVEYANTFPGSDGAGGAAPKDNSASLNATAARIKSEADLAYTLQDAAGKSQLALLKMQFDARVLTETDYLAKKQVIEQTEADAAIKRIQDNLVAENNAYLKSGNPADKERHQATMNKLTGELGAAWQKAADVGLTEYYRVLGEANKAYTDIQKSIEAAGKTEIASLDKAIAAQKLHNAEIGKTPAQIALAKASVEGLAIVELQRDADNLRAAARMDEFGQSAAGEFRGIYLEEANLLDGQIARRQILAADMGEASMMENQLAAIKQQDKAWKDMWSTVEHTGKDVFVQWFSNGKSAFEGIGRALKASVIDLLYQITAKQWLVSIGASVSGAGVSGMANAADMMGGGSGGTGSWLSAGKSLYEGFSGAFVYDSAATTGLSGMYNAAATSSYGASVGLSNTFYTAPGTGAAYGTTSGMGSAIGAAGSYIGAGMAGIAVGSMIAGDKEVLGMDGTTASAIGAAIGAAITLNPLGALVGGIIGGVVDAAFGMGPKKGGTTLLAGEFSGAGFAGDYQTPWKKDGGWFRSDQSGMQTDPVPVAQQSALQNVIAGSESVFDKLTTVAGEANRSLTGWTFAVERQVSTQEQQTQLIIDAANSMGAYLIPELSTFQKTGENLADTAVRLTDEFLLTDKMAGLMGVDVSRAFGAVGMASLKARDDLIALLGGIPQATATMQTYYQNFYTGAEQHANSLLALNTGFTKMNLTMPATREGFRALVEAEAALGPAHAANVAGLLAMNEAYAAAVPATAALQQSTWELYNSQTDSVRGMITVYDGSTAATTALTAATLNRYATEAQLVNQIAAAMGNVSTMFSTSAEQMRLSVMDSQQKQHYFVDQANALEEQLRAAVDPAKIEDLAKRLNDAENNAWANLDDTQRKAQLESYTKNFDEINTLVQTKLGTTLDEIKNSPANQLPAQIKDAVVSAMAEVAAAQMAAAVAQQEAANTAQIVADTPKKLDVTFHANVPGDAQVAVL